MIKTKLGVTICGAAGKMGRANLEVFIKSEDVRIVGALESSDSPCIGRDAGSIAGLERLDVSITPSLESVIDSTDVVIDFTTVSATLSHVRIAREHKKAIVIGTTGFDDIQLADIEQSAQHIPILLSPNMSPGVNILFYLVGQAAHLFL